MYGSKKSLILKGCQKEKPTRNDSRAAKMKIMLGLFGKLPKRKHIGKVWQAAKEKSTLRILADCQANSMFGNF